MWRARSVTPGMSSLQTEWGEENRRKTKNNISPSSHRLIHLFNIQHHLRLVTHAHRADGIFHPHESYFRFFSFFETGSSYDRAVMRWHVWKRGQFYSFQCASWNRRSPRAGVTRVAAGRTLATMKFGHRFQQAIEATHPSVSDQVRPRALDDPPAAPSARVCPQTEGLSCQRAAR